jgi:ATP-dependent Clp protease protease subunit
MDLKHFINKSKNEYEIILSGEVGFDIRGKEIANEIRYLNSIGATKITERINSGGGFVTDGYDIVDANLNSKAIIETIITGLAASTAGWLAATGTNGHRFIVDYGKGMIHDPSLGGATIEDMPEGADKEGLISIKDSIATILSNRSSIKKEKINEMMTKETWLSADEWVSMGFADKVIETTDKPIVKDSYNILEFVNACKEVGKNNNNKKDNKMKQVFNYLKLSEDAHEVSVLNAVQGIEKRATKAEEKADELTNDISNLTTESERKDSEIQELKNKVQGFETAQIENAVKVAMDSGKFSDDASETLTKQCTAMGIENFNEMVDMFKIPQANAAAQVNNSNVDTKKTSEEKLADEYEDLWKNNPEELKRIKNENPTKFEKMLNAWNEQ